MIEMINEIVVMVRSKKVGTEIDHKIAYIFKYIFCFSIQKLE
jgi:hypothetical protein